MQCSGCIRKLHQQPPKSFLVSDTILCAAYFQVASLQPCSSWSTPPFPSFGLERRRIHWTKLTCCVSEYLRGLFKKPVFIGFPIGIVSVGCSKRVFGLSYLNVVTPLRPLAAGSTHLACTIDSFLAPLCALLFNILLMCRRSRAVWDCFAAVPIFLSFYSKISNFIIQHTPLQRV